MILRSVHIRNVFGQSISWSNGEHWRKHRLIINTGFNTDAFKNYFPIFNEVLNKLFTKLELEKDSDFDCVPWLNRFTLDLLGKSVLNFDFGHLDSKISIYYEAYRTIAVESSPSTALLYRIFPFIDYLPLPITRRKIAAVNTMISLFNQIIQQHKETKHNDILDKLLAAKQEFTPTELLSDLWAFFLGGHETTATALHWAIGEIAENQDIQENLYQEIIRVYGNDLPSFESVANPPAYLNAFLTENLRRHPPAAIVLSRSSDEDIPYGDQIIPAGSQIGIDFMTIHHHPDYWENPMKFDPERFMPGNTKGRHKFSYLPFSLGPRQCFGNEFSLIEQRLFFVRLLQRWKVLLPKYHTPKDLKVPIFLFTKTEPFYIRLEERK